MGSTPQMSITKVGGTSHRTASEHLLLPGVGSWQWYPLEGGVWGPLGTSQGHHTSSRKAVVLQGVGVRRSAFSGDVWRAGGDDG